MIQIGHILLSVIALRAMPDTASPKMSAPTWLRHA